MTKKKTLACLCVLAASALWGCVGVFVRVMNKAGLQALEVLQVRSIVGAVCIGVYLLLFHREKLRFRLKDIWCFWAWACATCCSCRTVSSRGFPSAAWR